MRHLRKLTTRKFKYTKRSKNVNKRNTKINRKRTKNVNKINTKINRKRTKNVNKRKTNSKRLTKRKSVRKQMRKKMRGGEVSAHEKLINRRIELVEEANEEAEKARKERVKLLMSAF